MLSLERTLTQKMKG